MYYLLNAAAGNSIGLKIIVGIVVFVVVVPVMIPVAYFLNKKPHSKKRLIYIGMTEAELISKCGVPQTTTVINNDEKVVTYVQASRYFRKTMNVLIKNGVVNHVDSNP